MNTLVAFSYGFLSALSLIVGLFFVKYWRTSGDRFFVFFALSFLGLAATWASLAWAGLEEHYVYMPRLLAFLMIIVGIIDKNRRNRLASDEAR